MIGVKKYVKMSENKSSEVIMKKRLVNTGDIVPACEYCLHGRLSPDGENILCIKRGIMLPYSSCKKYSYDPLKRVPKRFAGFPQFDASDFKL